MEILLAHFQLYQKFLGAIHQRTPHVLTIVPFSRNAQSYMNNDIVILSQLRKIEVDLFVNG